MTLVDTSAWIEALRTDGDQAVRAAVESALRAGQAVLCDMVVLELWNGARGDDERAKLGRIIETLTCLPTTDHVWATAHQTAIVCRAQGITIPATDVLIASTARVHGASLLERDRHFGMIPDA